MGDRSSQTDAINTIAYSAGLLSWRTNMNVCLACTETTQVKLSGLASLLHVRFLLANWAHFVIVLALLNIPAALSVRSCLLPVTSSGLLVSGLLGVARQWAYRVVCNRGALVLTMYLFYRNGLHACCVGTYRLQLRSTGQAGVSLPKLTLRLIVRFLL